MSCYGDYCSECGFLKEDCYCPTQIKWQSRGSNKPNPNYKRNLRKEVDYMNSMTESHRKTASGFVKRVTKYALKEGMKIKPYE